MTDLAQARVGSLEDVPPGAMLRAWRRARAHLFNGVVNTVLTLLIAYAFLKLVVPLVQWALLDAIWSADSDRACQASGGACWAFLQSWGRFIIFGRFPYAEQWRPALVLVLFVAMLAASSRPGVRGRTLVAIWSGGLVAVGALMWGGFLGMPYVETELWNGLPLTLILAMGGVGFAFPIGVLAALGRRSKLPAIRWLSIAYIELIRGVPLITLLFMATLMVPLFLPTGVSIAKLWRAEIGFALFFGAYLAEAIRGGLQAIPRGQFEAADALGLGYWRKTYLIVLPQALAISIPAIVNLFIGAFKDTTLITIVGIFDILQDANTGLNDPAWRHAYVEAYATIGMIFFAFCYFMSRDSQYLERRMRRTGTGPRRK